MPRPYRETAQAQNETLSWVALGPKQTLHTGPVLQPPTDNDTFAISLLQGLALGSAALKDEGCLLLTMVGLLWINFLQNKHKIHIQGTDLPDPIATFQQLEQEYKINSRLLQNILGGGFQMPTPIQMQAVPVMLHGRELLASAPTGSGTTLAFSIPIIMQLKQPTNKGFRALIISPTRELASQIHQELVQISEGTGFRIHMIHKAAVAARKFGPKSSKKFGKGFMFEM
ncbi:probable ATP-dependent RNA helicase DDX52 [Saccopteryx leptura]|uniref:probable ATP-dependent RNA helicase DDX52 n=1 Tax=Saccopteryx leptura TaxID=249018 RepID=UPI00339BC2B2